MNSFKVTTLSRFILNLVMNLFIGALGSSGLFLSQVALAHEGDSGPIQPLSVQTFPLSPENKLHVLVRNDSHTEGKKYLVELRPSCGKNQDWTKSAVVDMQSACDVDAKFFKFDPQAKKLQIRIKDPNSNLRNFNSVNEKLDAAISCNQQWKLFSFDLSSICQ